MAVIKVHFEHPDNFIPWCGASGQIERNGYKVDARTTKKRREINCKGCRRLIKRAIKQFKLFPT